jgi:hypothetical protein
MKTQKFVPSTTSHVVHRIGRTHEQIEADVIALYIQSGWRELTV